ncbi:MAG TPA: ribosome-associated translation inhibitor RaiA [Paenibacillaceae bacterium]
MRYNVRGRQMEVTKAIRDYIEKKLGRLEKYFVTPPDTDVNVTISVIRDQHVVEVTIPLPGVVLRAEERSNDMYASIDLVVDKLERQIRKHKTKINRKFRQTGLAKGPFKEDVPAAGAVNGAEPADEDEYELVRVKRFELKPMDVQEAILQMNLLGHSFFVFENSDTNQVNVVYRRADGRYGLIETAH